MKNMIISILTVWILNMYGGWHVQGIGRAAISSGLVISIYLLVCIVDAAYKKYVKNVK